MLWRRTAPARELRNWRQLQPVFDCHCCESCSPARSLARSLALVSQRLFATSLMSYYIIRLLYWVRRFCACFKSMHRLAGQNSPSSNQLGTVAMEMLCCSFHSFLCNLANLAHIECSQMALKCAHCFGTTAQCAHTSTEVERFRADSCAGRPAARLKRATLRSSENRLPMALPGKSSTCLTDGQWPEHGLSNLLKTKPCFFPSLPALQSLAS